MMTFRNLTDALDVPLETTARRLGITPRHLSRLRADPSKTKLRLDTANRIEAMFGPDVLKQFRGVYATSDRAGL